MRQDLHIGLCSLQVLRQKLKLVLLGVEPYEQADDTASSTRRSDDALDVFDLQMEEAVRNIQQSRGLNVSGVLDSITEGHINEELARQSRFVVAGIVRSIENHAFEGALIEVCDRDLRNRQSLGKAITNSRGEYVIVYDRIRFCRAEKENADLVVIATDPKTNVSIKSEIRFNASHVEIIDLVLEEKDDDCHVSEYERYQENLKPVLDDVKLHELDDEDIAFIHGETGIPIWHVRFLRLDAKLSRAWKIKKGICYAWMRQGLPATESRLLTTETSRLRDAFERSIEQNIVSGKLLAHLDEAIAAVEQRRRPVKSELVNLQEYARLAPEEIEGKDPASYQRLVDAALTEVARTLDEHFAEGSEDLRFAVSALDLRELPQADGTIADFVRAMIAASDLGQAAKEEGFRRIAELSGPETFHEMLRPSEPIERNPLFRRGINGGLLYRLGDLSGLDDGKIEALLARDIRTDWITAEQLASFVSDGVLSRVEADRFGLNANLLQVSGADLGLVAAIKSSFGDGSLASLRDLAHRFSKRSDWELLLEQAQIEPRDGSSRKEYAALRQKQIEVLFPHDVFHSQHEAIDSGTLASNLEGLEPLFDRNPRLFHGIGFSELDVGDLDAQDRATIEAAYKTVSRQANRHPGLELDGVLNDSALSLAARAAEAARRVDLMTSFFQANESEAFLSLNLSAGSDDLSRIDLANFSDQDRSLILNNLRADQRVYRVTQDTEHAYLLMERGFHSAAQIVDSGFKTFVRTTGLDHRNAVVYYATAGEIAVENGVRLGIINDIENDPSIDSPVNNTPHEYHHYLRRIEGIEALFGNQDFCKCKHCSSIYSPAAYYVDLMHFVETYVMDAYFPGSHPISPRVRRPDLWTSVPLTCEATHELVPYLTIILEVLENYLIRETISFTGDPDIRNQVEATVYEHLYERAELNGFTQPFHLPLTELHTYLGYFPTTLEAIARTVRAFEDDAEESISRAALNLSGRAYSLIERPTLDSGDYDPDFLASIYRIDLPVDPSSPPESKVFLEVMRVSRQELADILDSTFVTANGTERVTFEGRRRDGDPELQPDMEVVKGLTLAILDRMHRFTRLWRQVDWSIEELDQVIGSIPSSMAEDEEHIPLEVIVGAVSLQREFGLTVPQLSVLLSGTFPSTGGNALFHALFNQPAFARVEEWNSTGVNGSFTHPAFEDGMPEENAVVTHHRLLAGLGLDDDSFVRLIDHLRRPLSMGADDAFSLSPENLALLYEHAVVSRALGVSMNEMFALMRMSGRVPAGHLGDVADAHELAEFTGWQRDHGFTIEELALILDDVAVATGGRPDAAEIGRNVIDRIWKGQTLIFADTAFAFFEGVSETQSREIIRVNDTRIVPANIQIYRIKPGLDPETVTVTIPPELAGVSGLTERVREIAATNRQAIESNDVDRILEVSDRSISAQAGISLDHAHELLQANEAIFTRVSEPLLYWLAASFDFDEPLAMPEDVTLLEDAARDHLRRFQPAKVFADALARELGVPAEKLLNLASLSPDGLTSGRQITELAEALQASNLFTIEREVARLSLLSLWFKDSAWDQHSLKYVATNATGPGSIFRIDNFHEPRTEDLRQTCLYLALKNRMNGEPQQLHDVLLGFDFAGTERFSDGVIDELAAVVAIEPSVVRTLNESLAFPTGIDPTTGAQINHALLALQKLGKCAELVKFLGIGGEALPLMVSDEYADLRQAVTAVTTAIRSKYGTAEEYEKTIDPYQDRIREQRRDALTEYLLHSLDTKLFTTTNDLYHYFLIDTELEGCALTSRLVAGTNSLQLYIQRAIMNLEQTEIDDPDRVQVVLPNEAMEQWKWRKNYRVWEANRKVFFYPECYIEPDLRDNKTELFREIEEEILQQQINTQGVLNAYTRYLRGFEEIARLQIAGAYHELSNGQDVLHVVAVTLSEPREHYYRAIEKATTKPVWNSWERLSLQIPVNPVSPIVFEGRLYLFWAEIDTRPESKTISGRSQFVGYKHALTIKLSALRPDGNWSSPQTIKQHPDATDHAPTAVVNDLLLDNSEIPDFDFEVTHTRTDGEVTPLRPLDMPFEDLRDAFRSGLTKAILENPSLFSSTSHPVDMKVGDYLFKHRIDFSKPAIRNSFIPAHADTVHLEAQDDYTLTGYRWDRVYPSPDSQFGWLGAEPVKRRLRLVGRDFDMRSHIDFYSRSIGPNLSSPSFPVVHWIRNVLGELFVPIRFARLNLTGRELSVGYEWEYSEGEEFAKATRYLQNDTGFEAADLYDPRLLLTLQQNATSAVVVNGALSDAFLGFEDDSFLVLARRSLDVGYEAQRFGTTLSGTVSRRFFSGGVDELLALGTQQALVEASPPFGPTSLVESATAEGIDYEGSLGVYFREVFFHLPYLIANHLNSQGKFAEAQRWYHFIFDPTSNEIPPAASGLTGEAARRNEASRVWQYLEFRNYTEGTLRDLLNDLNAIELYKRDPFNPHAIARQRLGAYRKNIVMKYIDNLLDWGDHLFAQDTRESINEATLLYVMACDLLGERPQEIGDCPEHLEELRSYNFAKDAAADRFRGQGGLTTAIEGAGSGRPLGIRGSGSLDFVSPVAPETLAKAEAEANRRKESREQIVEVREGVGGVTSDRGHDFGFERHVDDGVSTGQPSWRDQSVILPSFATSLLKQATIFCIPPSPCFLEYWDRCEDRLYKIRSCLNISGVRRELPLFAPEIDPRLLVRAKAAGLTLDEVLDTIHGDLPPFRFSFLIAKAKEYVGALQSYSNSLLSALEKKDAEHLSRMRLEDQLNMLKLTRRQRDLEVDAAEENLESLRRRQETIDKRFTHFDDLLNEGLTTLEATTDALQYVGKAYQLAATPFALTAASASLPPSILGFSFSTPSGSLKNFAEGMAHAYNAMGQLSLIASSMTDKQAGYDRREQGWRFSRDQAASELREIERQVLVAEIRRDLAIKSRDLHERNIENLEETFEFYRDKFTNEGLYTWLSTQLQRFSREAYQAAMTICRLAERAYRFERSDDTTPLLERSYWDAGHAGLMAGERLTNDLRSMELRFMETYTRQMEIDQAFSLTQLDPASLIELKETGKCEFSIPELFYDLYYPGQYRRRIRSARLTIPCITGPYTNVSATLTLTGSRIRKEAKLEDHEIFDLPPSRTVTVATSTAQNDSGVFQLDFGGERYMPFEGAGAISSWRLELPKAFRPFDYSTINDVILHVSYTAEYSETLRAAVDDAAGHLQTVLSTATLQRVLSLRQEFSQSFHALLHSGLNEPVDIDISEKHFPIFLSGKTLHITRMKLILGAESRLFEGAAGEKPTISVSGNATNTRIGPTELDPDPAFGELLRAELPPSFIGDFEPGSDTKTIQLSVDDAGALAPESPAPSDSATLDSHKLKDVYLYFEYGMALAAPT